MPLSCFKTLSYADGCDRNFALAVGEVDALFAAGEGESLAFPHPSPSPAIKFGFLFFSGTGEGLTEAIFVIVETSIQKKSNSPAPLTVATSPTHGFDKNFALAVGEVDALFAAGEGESLTFPHPSPSPAIKFGFLFFSGAGEGLREAISVKFEKLTAVREVDGAQQSIKDRIEKLFFKPAG